MVRRRKEPRSTQRDEICDVLRLNLRHTGKLKVFYDKPFPGPRNITINDSLDLIACTYNHFCNCPALGFTGLSTGGSDWQKEHSICFDSLVT